MLAEAAFADINHLLRPAHLKQLASILEDPEATDNDRFVAYDLLKNADSDDQDTARRLALDRKALKQFGVDTDAGRAVDSQRILPDPGTRNISATRGSRTTFRNESMRLLPRRSGSIRVRSSWMRTKPRSSPRSVQSRPSGPTVARAQNGEACRIRAYFSEIAVATLARDVSPGTPYRWVQFLDGCNNAHA